jgi:hypothetical protein
VPGSHPKAQRPAHAHGAALSILTRTPPGTRTVVSRSARKRSRQCACSHSMRYACRAESPPRVLDVAGASDDIVPAAMRAGTTPTGKIGGGPDTQRRTAHRPGEHSNAAHADRFIMSTVLGGTPRAGTDSNYHELSYPPGFPHLRICRDSVLIRFTHMPGVDRHHRLNWRPWTPTSKSGHCRSGLTD